MSDTEGILADLFALRERVNALIDKVSGKPEKVTAAPPKQVAERIAANLCIFCGERPAETRGLCNPHYQGTRRALINEGISDAEAIATWRWLPEGRKGRKSKYTTGLPTHPAALEGAIKMNRKKKKP